MIYFPILVTGCNKQYNETNNAKVTVVMSNTSCGLGLSNLLSGLYSLSPMAINGIANKAISIPHGRLGSKGIRQ